MKPLDQLGVTPVPWDLETKPGLFPSVLLGPIVGGRRAGICVNEGPSPAMLRGRAPSVGTTLETSIANARLMAAAPQLYEALWGLVLARESVTIGLERERLKKYWPMALEALKAAGGE